MKTQDQIVERFWKSVDKKSDNDCWYWLGKVHNNSKAPYGRFFIKVRRVYAHRFSYELHFGTIPKGMEIRHKCNNHRCVNPNHLTVGTHAQNMQDSIKAGTFFFAVGDKNGKAKITNETAREVKRQFVPGRGNALKLANKLGIPVGIVYSIVNGTNWKWVKI